VTDSASTLAAGAAVADPVPTIPAYEPVAAPTGTLNTWILPNVGGIFAVLTLWIGTFFGLEFAAWAIAFAAWLFNRAGHVLTLWMVRGLPQTVAVAAAGFGMMLRIWIIAFALFLVGADFAMGDRDRALTAIGLFVVFFTIDVAARSILHLRAYKAAGSPLPAEETLA